MSIDVMRLVWKKAPYEGNTLLTMLALADWSDDYGVSWPSEPVLAKKSRQSDRNVRRCLNKMQEDGFLEVEEREGTSNRYTINLRALEEIAGTPDKMSTPTPDKMSTLPRTSATKKGAQMSAYTSVDTSVDTPLIAGSEKTEPEEAGTPKTKPKAVDPRYTPLKDRIQQSWMYVNKAQEAPWGPAEAGQLGRLLKKLPTTPFEKFEQACRNWIKSNSRYHRNVTYLCANLDTFLAGPRDKWGELIVGVEPFEDRDDAPELPQESASAKARRINATGTVHKRG